MSNTTIFKDFYQVPNVKFDISKLRADLDRFLKKIKVANFRDYKFSCNTYEQNTWR